MMSMRGYVYAITAPELDRVKIGVAKNVHKRLTTLQCGSPCDLVIHSAREHEYPLLVERRLHRRFKDAFVKGEWFDISHPKVQSWLALRIESGDQVIQRKIGKQKRKAGGFTKGRPPKELNLAIRWLESTLQNEGSIRAVEIKELAEGNNISHRTLENAKYAIGAKSTKNSTGWWWSLP